MTVTCPANVLSLEHSTKSPRAALTTGDVTHGGASMSVSYSNTLFSAVCDSETVPAKWKRFVVDHDTGCWVWTGPTNKAGYGVMLRLHGQAHLAHRAFYEFFFGELDHSVPVHHLCRNKACVNPAHMEGTPQHIHSRIHAGTQLTSRDVNLIRWLVVHKEMTAREISLEYGFSLAATEGVVSGKSWRSLT